MRAASLTPLSRAFVTEPAAVRLVDQQAHALRIRHVARRVAEVEFGQVARQVFAADVVVGSVN